MAIDISLFFVAEKEDEFFDFWNFDLDKCNLQKTEVNFCRSSFSWKLCPMVGRRSRFYLM